jgi:riboflavin kinase/FMN adenylyltransferase
MRVLPVAHSLDDVRRWAPRDAALTLGVFDGVHLGHKRIIDDLVSSRNAGALGGCYLITFDPHPLVVTHSKVVPPMLTTLDERIELLSRFDLDGVLVLRFDEELANVTYPAFVQKYLVRAFDMKLLILGYDCRFGKNREGTPDRVKSIAAKTGFECRVVEAVRGDEDAISSTTIRNALIEGDLVTANRLLGHPYLIMGKVVRGHGKGTDLGFPTANIAIRDPYKLWPPSGVYAVKARHGRRELRGMMNIGRSPTVKQLEPDVSEIEVHLFDFEGDIYGEELWVECHTYLRRERKFPSMTELIRQMEADRQRTLEVFARASGGG